MILQNIAYLITQNRERSILEDIDIKIKDDKITAIGKDLKTNEEKVIDCSNKIVMPGLINAHTHVPMTLLRGISDNKILQNWLKEDIFPAEEKLNEQDVFVGSLLGTIEMLKTGTTTFNEMYDNMEEIAEAVETTGIRAVLSQGIINKETDERETIEQALNFVQKYQNHELVTPGFAPHAIYTVKEQTLQELQDYSEIFDTIYHIHVSETEKENSDSLENNGLTPIQYLNKLGAVNKRLVAAHGAWVDEEDIEILRKNKGNIVHNPAANLKLGSGIAPVPKLLENNVNVALGTDGVASNNNLNLFEEGKLASILHKKDDPRNINEQQILDMMTINGAKALDKENQIGSIEIGKKADLLLIDLDQLELNPWHGKEGLLSNLIYSFNGEVDTVIVNGDIRVRDKEIQGIHEKEVLKEARKRAEKLR